MCGVLTPCRLHRVTLACCTAKGLATLLPRQPQRCCALVLEAGLAQESPVLKDASLHISFLPDHRLLAGETMPTSTGTVNVVHDSVPHSPTRYRARTPRRGTPVMASVLWTPLPCAPSSAPVEPSSPFALALGGASCAPDILTASHIPLTAAHAGSPALVPMFGIVDMLEGQVVRVEERGDPGAAGSSRRVFATCPAPNMAGCARRLLTHLLLRRVVDCHNLVSPAGARLPIYGDSTLSQADKPQQ